MQRYHIEEEEAMAVCEQKKGKHISSDAKWIQQGEFSITPEAH